MTKNEIRLTLKAFLENKEYTKMGLKLEDLNKETIQRKNIKVGDLGSRIAYHTALFNTKDNFIIKINKIEEEDKGLILYVDRREKQENGSSKIKKRIIRIELSEKGIIEKRDRAEYMSKYRIENKDSLKEKYNKRMEENGEDIKARRKEYYLENREERLAYKKEYYEDNKEDILIKGRAYSKKYYAENKDDLLEKKRIKRRQKKEEASKDVK